MANLIIKMNALNNEFERLKQVFRQPRLCIHNYFRDLRTEIDATYALKTDELNHKTWLDLISKVDSFERDCMRGFKKFNIDTTQETEDKIEFVETKLKLLNTHNVEISFKANSAEKLIDDLTYLVSNQVIELERFLFLNQTMVFIDLKNYELNDSHKLIFIKNEYFGKIATQMIKNFTGFTSQKLTNEILKSNEFKNIIRNKSQLHNRQIYETELNLNAITHVELPRADYKHIDSNVFKDFLNLKVINLQFNKLKSIDSNVFTGLINLTHINLRGNGITHLAFNLFDGLINLEELNLARNELKSLNTSLFNGLFSLIEIDISNNKLENVSAHQFDGLFNLKCIRLNGNQIRNLDHENLFKDLRNLAFVDLSANQFKRRNQFSFVHRSIFDKVHIKW